MLFFSSLHKSRVVSGILTAFHPFSQSYKYQNNESLPKDGSNTGSKSRLHRPVPIPGSTFPLLRAVCFLECCRDGSAWRSGTASSPCGAVQYEDRSPASRWDSYILMNTTHNNLRTCMFEAELSTISSERLGVNKSTDSSSWNSTPRFRSVRYSTPKSLNSFPTDAKDRARHWIRSAAFFQFSGLWKEWPLPKTYLFLHSNSK